MKRPILAVLLLTLAPALAQAETPRATIKGYVIDSACLFVKNLDKPVVGEDHPKPTLARSARPR